MLVVTSADILLFATRPTHSTSPYQYLIVLIWAADAVSLEQVLTYRPPDFTNRLKHSWMEIPISSYSITTIKPYQIHPSVHCVLACTIMAEIDTRWTPNACVGLCKSMKTNLCSLLIPRTSHCICLFVISGIRDPRPIRWPIVLLIPKVPLLSTSSCWHGSWDDKVYFLCTLRSSELLLPCMLFMVVLLPTVR
jgi:hypothetical protein